mmetsp:Transcript_38167/g.50281  ORF Transcript_38167/g.50281 Transcript_38167/m.50281 type:complete len:84 (+) Transcript_38167:54-305(+)
MASQHWSLGDKNIQQNTVNSLFNYVDVLFCLYHQLLFEQFSCKSSRRMQAFSSSPASIPKTSHHGRFELVWILGEDLVNSMAM